MVETLIKTLQQKYLIKTNTISKQKGGWASLAEFNLQMQQNSD